MHVRAKVTAGARKESLTEVSARSYIITVREPAERNEANRRVRELLAKKFKVPIGAVHLIKGGKTRSKLFEILAKHEN